MRATVNTHVSHILTKLDAHSRVDIAREVTVRWRPIAHPRSPYEDRPRTAPGRG
jgi:Bacterial regulatory proteins, luxR family